ncbi:MAG: 4-alpha-glucanotransferase, partial [Verrucomicrobiota bacterium]
MIAAPGGIDPGGAPEFTHCHNERVIELPAFFEVGNEAVKDAIEFCAENGFTVLQILPIHETFGDHSPYNPISSRAHSPALVSVS